MNCLLSSTLTLIRRAARRELLQLARNSQNSDPDSASSLGGELVGCAGALLEEPVTLGAL